MVEKIENDTVFVRPDLRDTDGDWFYWNFKVTCGQGQKLFFKFPRSNVFAKFGPGMSRDSGKSWHWLGGGSIVGNGFSFSFSPMDTLVQFCVAFPYVQSHLQYFLDNLENVEILRQDTLCISRKGRAVEKIFIPPTQEVKSRVLVTARHHACEMMANFVVEGILESLLNDSDLLWARENIEFCIIPFVDKDGVEDGDQGKNRRPRDHNRDYADESIHYTTAAIREQIPTWSQGASTLALDIHCPWIRGDRNENIYIVGSQDSANAVEQQWFAEIVEKTHQGDLPFFAADYLQFGTEWNKMGNYKKGHSFTRWADSLPFVPLSACIEFPYAAVHDQQVRIEGARQFGRSLALSLQKYIQYTNNCFFK